MERPRLGDQGGRLCGKHVISKVIFVDNINANEFSRWRQQPAQRWWRSMSRTWAACGSGVLSVMHEPDSGFSTPKVKWSTNLVGYLHEHAVRRRAGIELSTDRNLALELQVTSEPFDLHLKWRHVSPFDYILDDATHTLPNRSDLLQTGSLPRLGSR